MTTTPAFATAVRTHPLAVRLAAALAGVLVVAAASQVAIPIPGSPVPFTLQPLAVLIVGGLLGPRYGALSLALYLLLGAAGLPVFAPFGPPGLARLAGPTGGFLLSYPVAACVTGWGAAQGGDRRLPFALLATLAGTAVIFAGGVAQLAVFDSRAVALGLLPFIWTDLVKALLAGLAIRRFAATTRALR